MRTYNYYHDASPSRPPGFLGEITDAETGELIYVIDGDDIFGDNWMADSQDLLGLHQHLEHHGIIRDEDDLRFSNTDQH